MTDNIINKGCCGYPSQCWEPCGDLGKSLLHTRASSKVRKQAVRDAVRRHDMTDNSPEYFEQAAKDIEAFSGLYAYAATNNAVREMSFRGACRSFRDTFLSAAALARENAELRENLRVVNEQKVHEGQKWSEHCESAESANRALQAEVDRLAENNLVLAKRLQSLEDDCWSWRKTADVLQAEVNRLNNGLDKKSVGVFNR